MTTPRIHSSMKKVDSSGAVAERMKKVKALTWGVLKGRRSIYVDIRGLVGEWFYGKQSNYINAAFEGGCLMVRYLGSGVYEIRCSNEKVETELLLKGFIAVNLVNAHANGKNVVVNGLNAIITEENPLEIKTCVVKIMNYSFDMSLTALEDMFIKKGVRLMGKAIPGTRWFQGECFLSGDIYLRMRLTEGLQDVLKEKMIVEEDGCNCEIDLVSGMLFMKCFNCYGMGHAAKDCVNEVTCAKCKKSGHIAKFCTSREPESHIENEEQVEQVEKEKESVEEVSDTAKENNLEIETEIDQDPRNAHNGDKQLSDLQNVDAQNGDSHDEDIDMSTSEKRKLSPNGNMPKQQKGEGKTYSIEVVDTLSKNG